ncbi:hypothetical protein Dimus_003418 [Dionaea muscipula]
MLVGALHFRRPPPSPGLPIRHRRTPSPMPLSSPKPAEVSSTEDGEVTAAAVTTSEDEDHSDLEGGMMNSSHLFLSTSFPVEFSRSEGLTMASSSGSSTLSPTAAVLFCREAIDDGGRADGRLKLARADSVCFVSSPSLGGCNSVSMESVARWWSIELHDDGRSGMAGVIVSRPPSDSVSPIRSTFLARRAPLEAVRWWWGRDRVVVDDSVAGCNVTQRFIDDGEVSIPTVVVDEVRSPRCHKVSSSSDFSPSFVAAAVVAGVRKVVHPMLVSVIFLRQVGLFVMHLSRHLVGW